MSMKRTSRAWTNDDSKTLAEPPSSSSWPEIPETLPVVEPSHAPRDADRIHISINNVTTKHSSRSLATLLTMAGFTVLSILCLWHFWLSDSVASFTITPFFVASDLAPRVEAGLNVGSGDTAAHGATSHAHAPEQKTVTLPGGTVTKTVRTVIKIGDGHVRTTRTLPGKIVTKVIKTTILTDALPQSLSVTPFLTGPTPSSGSSPSSSSSNTVVAPLPAPSFPPPSIPTPSASPTISPSHLSEDGNCTSTYHWTQPAPADFIETVYRLTANVTSWLDCGGCPHLAVQSSPRSTLASFTSAILATGPTSLVKFSCLPPTGIALDGGTVTTTATVTATARRTVTTTITLAPGTSDLAKESELASLARLLSGNLDDVGGDGQGTHKTSEESHKMGVHTVMETAWVDVTVTNG